MAIKAQFITGKDQRILPLRAKVTGDHELGAAVTITTDTNGVKTIAAATSTTAATHIIALTDETVGGNIDKVFPGSIQEAAKLASTRFNTVAASDTEKKVGVYPIFDEDDVIFSGTADTSAGEDEE